ncbi:MAG: hypothetical protein FWD31_06760 [Planctomycetaceae bacterium]|nr:hypothetical protein [Planctomycetaceae bacterium]
MKTMTKTKTFDCVRMKNDIQAKIYAETKDMSTAELLAYFNRQPENSHSDYTEEREVLHKDVSMNDIVASIAERKNKSSQ